jgi:hypothetical protein
MATTAVVAETVIAGLEATAWLMLLLLTVFGTDWIEADALSDFAALTTIGVLATAYVLGIIVDRAADSLFGWLRKKPAGEWLNRRFGKDTPEPSSFSVMRLEALRQGGPLAAFIEFQRSRLRLMRGTALNLAIAAPVVFGFLLRYAELWKAALGAGFVLAGFCASLPVAERIRTAYMERLTDAYELLVSQNKG